jgi:hypothetical protein
MPRAEITSYKPTCTNLLDEWIGDYAQTEVVATHYFWIADYTSM